MGLALEHPLLTPFPTQPLPKHIQGARKLGETTLYHFQTFSPLEFSKQIYGRFSHFMPTTVKFHTSMPEENIHRKFRTFYKFFLGLFLFPFASKIFK